ncbi:hypothetical protein OOK27_50760 [Streptomyces canus]|uniref:hypothetical protein n=1 Tax=Streptomyces canus TaxID=58343 RepID=UPI0022515365|nr:hypothetical protein [Streptomyces canus]MCX5262306.1 hypothetical protein [Streptomyces canus]
MSYFISQPENASALPGRTTVRFVIIEAEEREVDVVIANQEGINKEHFSASRI